MVVRRVDPSCAGTGPWIGLLLHRMTDETSKASIALTNERPISPIIEEYDVSCGLQLQQPSSTALLLCFFVALPVPLFVDDSNHLWRVWPMHVLLSACLSSSGSRL